MPQKKPDPETAFDAMKRRIYGISKLQFFISVLVSVLAGLMITLGVIGTINKETFYGKSQSGTDENNSKEYRSYRKRGILSEYHDGYGKFGFIILK